MLALEENELLPQGEGGGGWGVGLATAFGTLLVSGVVHWFPFAVLATFSQQKGSCLDLHS